MRFLVECVTGGYLPSSPVPIYQRAGIAGQYRFPYSALDAVGYWRGSGSGHAPENDSDGTRMMCWFNSR